MKRIFTLLLGCLIFFVPRALTQTTQPCNATFDYTVSAGLTVLFTPSIIGDAPAVQHKWFFGDGTSSEIASPTHTYASGGVYSVLHIFKRINPNGVVVCIDSARKTVQLANSSCNLVADFSSHPDTTNRLKIYFQNLSTPLHSSDSIRWTFGDGTSSLEVNPVHIYSQPGTYTVCLRVKKNTTAGPLACVKEICKTVIVSANNQCNLIANFTSRSDSSNSLRIIFSNLSTPVAPSDSIKWTFGDGTFSYDRNPVHLYTQPGVYNVCLRMKSFVAGTASTPCVREVCKTITVVSNNLCNLQASFTSHPDTTNGLSIYFNNTSSPISSTDSIRWTFGDGTSSLALNPVHVYSSPGTYTVCLRIKKNNTPGTAPCVREICKTITVVATPVCNLVAGFIHHRDSLLANKIHFINTTTPSTIANPFVKWSFGDGTYAYTWNADHVYAQPGTYQVCLRVSISNTCVREVCKVIVVTASCDRTVNFNTTVDPSNPRKIYFNNLTPGTVTDAKAKWTFGDGTSSTSWNAVHEYAQPGRYYVCLRVEFFPGCVREKCDTINVAPANTNCQEISKWKSTRFSSDCLRFLFEPLQKNSAWQYHWTFGDGTGSHEMSPNKKYARPGNYTVCLTVFKSLECASTTCGQIQTGDCINCDSVRLKFEYQRAPGMPNKISFTAVSSHQILSQQWTITKLPASISSPPVVLNQNNPTYVFPDTGYYLVCLKSTTSGGCVKEYCEVIRIGELGSNCSLQAYPNPAHNLVNVNVQLSQPDMIHAYVYNTLNVLVREKHQQGVTGNNVVTINVETLVPGQYTIKIVVGNRVCYAQFQKI